MEIDRCVFGRIQVECRSVIRRRVVVKRHRGVATIADCLKVKSLSAFSHESVQHPQYGNGDSRELCSAIFFYESRTSVETSFGPAVSAYSRSTTRFSSSTRTTVGFQSTASFSGTSAKVEIITLSPGLAR